MGYAWLNIGSVLLGLVSLITPIIYLVVPSKYINKNSGLFSGISISACAISLCMQIVYADYLVNIKDWTALMDTSATTVQVSVAFVVATIVLNIIVYIIKKLKYK